MNHLNRRSFFFTSSGAAAGAIAVPGLLEAAESADFSQSGLVTGQPKPLKNKEIPGFLSAPQIAPHHSAHYGGALKAFVAAVATLEESTKTGASIDPAAFAHLKRLINMPSTLTIRTARPSTLRNSCPTSIGLTPIAVSSRCSVVQGLIFEQCTASETPEKDDPRHSRDFSGR